MKGYLALFVCALFVLSACSQSQASGNDSSNNTGNQDKNTYQNQTVQQSKKKKQEIKKKEAITSKFKKLQGLYNSKKYTDFIQLYGKEYKTIKSNGKYLTQANKMYNNSFKKLLGNKKYFVINSLFSNSPILKIVLSDDLYKKIHEKSQEIDQKFKAVKRKADKNEQKEKQKEIDTLLKYIDKGEYAKIAGFISPFPDDKEIQTLTHYGEAKFNKSIGDFSEFLYTLAWIDPNYHGVRSKQILDFVKKNLSKDEWAKMHKKDIEYGGPIKAAEAEKPNKKNKTDPKIGMTREEARNSSWGQPEDINKTITSGDTSEQWVYPDNKYLYFDNGILTGIQE